MGSADEVNIQASELNRTMKVLQLLHPPHVIEPDVGWCSRRDVYGGQHDALR